MQAKAYLPTIFSTILSLILNLFHHHNLLVSLLNSVLLGLSIYFFQRYLTSIKSIFNILLIISLGAIPLFFYKPTESVISFLPLFSLGFLYFAKQNIPGYAVILIWGVFLFLGNLYSGEIIKYPFTIQHSQLIFNSPEINLHMYRHRQDALFIPYKVRQLVYSQLIYIYALLTNLFNFLNLKNLSDALLIANLYPLFIGLIKVIKQENRFRNICFAAFIITALTAGIDRSADRFQSLYLLGPLFIFLILTGTPNINKKIYITLWILSLFL